MAKIIDTYQYRQGLQCLLREIDESGKPTKAEFLARIAEIETRLCNTTDVVALQKLNATKNFYTSIARQIDLYDQYVKYTSTTFDNIDETYWQIVINGEKLKQENEFLKGTVINLQKQRDIIMDAWKSGKVRQEKIKLRVA